MNGATDVTAEHSDHTTDLYRLLSSLPIAVAVLDEDNRVVFGQERLLELVGLQDLPAGRRRRPGDLLSCVNALAGPDGCGTSEACAVCGARCALIESRTVGSAVTRECRVQFTTEVSRGDLDLTVTATPYRSGEVAYTLLTVQDASAEKRRRALERVFFHDILNTAGGLSGLVHMLRDTEDRAVQQEMLDTLERSARSLLDEIVAQRQLTSAESGDLELELRHVDSVALLHELAESMRYHDVAVDRRVELAPECERFTFRTDPTLLRRAIVNLTKNGLEAIPPGAAVTLRIRRAGIDSNRPTVVIEVHNPGAIPREVRLQLFRRSFSTKGAGRGLGTYGVRLLVEEYLGGSVTVTSSKNDGTVFRLEVPNVGDEV